MPAGNPESTVIIKDEYRVVIYYRNVSYSTGYTLDTTKNLKEQFKKGRITKSWGVDWEKANDAIYEKKNLIDTLIKEANRQGANANGYIKAYLDKKSNQVKQDVELGSFTVSQLFQNFIDFKNEKNKHKKKKTGIQKYLDLQKRLLEFETKGKKSAKWKNINQINLKWRNELCEFLVTKREEKIEVKDGERQFNIKKKRGLSNSTLNGYMYVLMNFFEWVEYNFRVELNRDLKEFTPYPSPTPEENIITPTLEQWNEFKEYIPNTKALHKTYDLSLLSAYSGMRYSDCITVCFDHVLKKGAKTFEYKEPLTIRKKLEEGAEEKAEELRIKKQAIKTDGWFEVTFNPVCIAIFEKYNRDLRQKFPGNQQTNKNLRSIWKTLPSWKTKVKYKTYILDKEIVAEDYFYNIASFHIFRKIFTTFLVAQNNFSTDEIMRMTGWKDERMLRHYRNVFNDYNRRNKQIMF